MEEEQITSNQNTYPEVAIFVGAGAIENAWNPVVRALKSFSRGPVTTYNANAILARIVYEMRFYSIVKNSTVESDELDIPRRFTNLKSMIAAEIQESEKSGELVGRVFFEYIFHKLVLPISNEFTFCTTNWDSAAERKARECLGSSYKMTIPAFHIHGTCENANSLYLPSEISLEPYRSKEEQMELLGKHAGLVDSLSGAKRIILYGLSISSLDAELGQCLAEGVNEGSVKEIFIVNPDHYKVAELLHVTLFDPRGIKIYGIDPLNPYKSI